MWHDRRVVRQPASRSRSGSARVVERSFVARLPGGDLPYVLRRSARARRLRVTVDPIRGVIATIPIRTAEARARSLVEPFLADREAWLRRHLGRRDAAMAAFGDGTVADGSLVPFLGEPHRLRVVRGAARSRTRVERVGAEAADELLVTLAVSERRELGAVLEAWFRARARAAVEVAIARHAPSLGVRPAAVTVRDPRTRWGSASRSGRLMLAWRLVLAPPSVLETVVVHELCHLRVFGHGPGFWDLVAGQVPDQARHRRWLRDHAAALHAALAG